MRSTRFAIAVLLATLAFATAPADAQDRKAGGPTRQRPPEAFACEPNDLTVYTGLVCATSGNVSAPRCASALTGIPTRTSRCRTTAPQTRRRLSLRGPAVHRERLGADRVVHRRAAAVHTRHGVGVQGRQVMVDWAVPKEG